ncbi:AraC family transcriptional regulator [Olivibacter domesticus]|uniref:AraC-type DNA-binding protein n=1 Tax=Olivibacter domesticus TaxID=407022 RepID=A0A1H7MJN4_OLID1|nr:helix-turn-helix domain-containing protein [Olivibacter domesticus]SEL11289.1 AraC-type DNA-binding protein [Olivibacter domesticus]
MKFITIQPPASLSRYVSSFWALEGSSSILSPYVFRLMADGMAALVFHYSGAFNEVYHDGRQEESIISGLTSQSEKFRIFSINRDFAMFGAHLYPYAISHLFSIPSTELKNQLIDLKSLLGKHDDGLEEGIMLAKDLPARVKIITRFLENRLCKIPPIPPGIFETINYITKTNGTIEVDALAQRNFLSMRQFERNFKQYSGFSPKTFSRIIRFQNALSQKDKSKKTLTQIAFDAGYSDQAHFIRDFKEFSGITPKEYFRERSENSNFKL